MVGRSRRAGLTVVRMSRRERDSLLRTIVRPEALRFFSAEEVARARGAIAGDVLGRLKPCAGSIPRLHSQGQEARRTQTDTGARTHKPITRTDPPRSPR